MSLLQKIPRKVWRFLDIINRLIKRIKKVYLFIQTWDSGII